MSSMDKLHNRVSDINRADIELRGLLTSYARFLPETQARVRVAVKDLREKFKKDEDSFNQGLKIIRQELEEFKDDYGLVERKK